MSHIMCTIALLAGSLYVNAANNELAYHAAVDKLLDVRQHGNVEEFAAMWEEGSRLNMLGFFSAVKENISLRGTPITCEIVYSECDEEAGFSILSVTWKDGIREREYYHWMLSRGRWQLTSNLANGQKPDNTIWKSYTQTLETASECHQPAQGERENVITLTKKLVLLILEGDYSGALRHVTPFSLMAACLGWNLDNELITMCKIDWLPMIQSIQLSKNNCDTILNKADAKWNCNQDLFTKIPGHTIKNHQKGYSCWRVTIYSESDGPFNNRLVATWIRTPNGLKLLDFQSSELTE